LNSLLSKLTQFPVNRLVWLLTLLGVLIAMQINYIQHGWINNDSVLYFEAARLFSTGEWKASFELWGWPLYPALIALVHTISGFSLHFSAQALNVLFFGIATLSFLQLIRLCGGDNLTLLCGALLLFSSQYIVGDALQMLLRDQGFWAFFLTGVVFFVRFYRNLSWMDAIAWQLAMIVAMLFRVEGITYLLALPFVLMFNKNLPWSTRGYVLLKSHCVNLSAGLVITGYLFIKGLSVSHLGRLQEVFSSRLLEELTQELVLRADIMANKVLGNYLEDFAIESLMLTFLFIMAAKTISSAGWITVVLAAYAGKLRQRLIEHDAWKILAAAMAIALVDMFLIILKVFVLSSRYIVPLTLMLIILAAFGLRHLAGQMSNTNRSRRYKWLVAGLLVILALGMVKNVLPKREGYHYELEAVAWLNQHNSQNLPTYYETPRLRYYAGKEFIGLGEKLNWPHLQNLIEKNQLQDYEYVLVSTNKNDPERVAFLEERLKSHVKVAEFKAVKGKKAILIYQRR
jgi:hypothetical protein